MQYCADENSSKDIVLAVVHIGDEPRGPDRVIGRQGVGHYWDVYNWGIGFSGRVLGGKARSPGSLVEGVLGPFENELTQQKADQVMNSVWDQNPGMMN